MLLVTLLLVIPAFIAGRSYQAVRDRRRLSLGINEALSRVTKPISGAQPGLHVLEPRRLSALDRKHYEILRLCEAGDWSRALTLIRGLGVSASGREIHELYVRLLLKFGCLDELEGTIDELRQKGGAPRLVFGAQIACGRWTEAASFYRARLQSQQGSLKETRLLAFLIGLSKSLPGSGMILNAGENSKLREPLSDILFDKSVLVSREAIPEASIEIGFELGIICPAEMSAWLNFEKKNVLCESQAQRVHLIDNSGARQDWQGFAHGLLKTGLRLHEPVPVLLSSVQLLAKPFVDSDRVYRCEHCSVLYAPFSVICPCCFTVGLGTPVRASAPECYADSLSACALGLDGLETLYWELILPLS